MRWWGIKSFFLPQRKTLTIISQYAHTRPSVQNRACQRFHPIRPWEQPMCFNFQNSHFILKLLPPLNSFWYHLVSQENLQQEGVRNCSSEGSWPLFPVQAPGSTLQICIRTGVCTVHSSPRLLVSCHCKSSHSFNIPFIPLPEFVLLSWEEEGTPPPCQAITSPPSSSPAGVSSPRIPSSPPWMFLSAVFVPPF